MSGFADFKDTLYVIAILVSLASTFYLWVTAGSRGNEKGLKELGDKVGAIDMRVAKIEGEIQHLPTKESQHRIELSISEISGDMKQMAEAQKSTTMTVRRMEDVLMKRGNES